MGGMGKMLEELILQQAPLQMHLNPALSMSLKTG